MRTILINISDSFVYFISYYLGFKNEGIIDLSSNILILSN